MNGEIVIECVRFYKFIYSSTEVGHADMRIMKNACYYQEEKSIV